LPFFNSQTTTISSAGHKYYVQFLDDFTNFLWTFPISRKSQVFETFKSLTKMIQTQFSQNVKSFQCDNGGEYNNELFRKYCTDHGHVFRFSCPHTSSQNGKAERKIKTINNMIRTMLAHSSVPTSFWHHALNMATYLLNILPNKTLQNQSPHNSYIIQIPPTHIYEFSVVYVILYFRPLTCTSYNLALVRVSSWVTR
jgi:hypothetical protein